MLTMLGRSTHFALCSSKYQPDTLEFELIERSTIQWTEKQQAA